MRTSCAMALALMAVMMSGWIAADALDTDLRKGTEGELRKSA